MKKFILAFGAAVTLVMAGCLKNEDDTNTRTCNYDPCAGKAPAAEIQKVKAYLDSAGITAVEHCSGLFYKIDEPGTGKTADACSGVYVQYKGQLANGNVFDSTAANDSVGFYLNQVIPGWTNGVPLVKEGGRIQLYIPPSLGYGSRANGPIPANSMLVFEVKLLRVVL